MSSKQISRVAVCGGGIGGLVLSAFLNQNQNIHVDIYEAKPEISTFGAGIALWKKFWDVLSNLGLDEELTKRGVFLPKEINPVLRKSDQPVGNEFHHYSMPYGLVVISRPTLLEIIQTKLTDKTKIHTSKRLLDYEYEPSGSIRLIFADGTIGHADILVGADGLRSATRSAMFLKLSEKTRTSIECEELKGFVDPIWSGTHVYRGFVDRKLLEEAHPNHPALDRFTIWCGQNGHAIIQPLDGVLGCGFYHTVETGEEPLYKGPMFMNVSTEEVLDIVENWEPDLLNLFKLMEKSSRWAVHCVKPLPQYVSGRVVLLGDAAHAMTPHQGAGGGLAIQDAHILGRLLCSPYTTLENINSVLQIYDKVRRPVTQRIAEGSRLNGFLYEFLHPDFKNSNESGPEELRELGDSISASFESLALGRSDEDWETVIAMLKLEVVVKNRFSH